MTREMKIALIVGFLLVLFVTVLISDHLSKARQSRLESAVAVQPPLAPPITMAPPTATPIVGGPVEATSQALPPDATVPPKAGGSLTDAPVDKPVELTLGRGSSGAEAIRSTRFPTSPIRGAVALDARTEPAPPSPEPSGKVAGKEHVVEEGESAYRIAKDSYGDGGLWRKLVDFNKGTMSAEGNVRVGAKLILPPKDVLLGQAKPADSRPAMQIKPDADAPKPLRVAQTPAGRTATPKGRTYVVQKGDTLGDIARKELGSSKRAKDIMQQNAGTLKDPASMQPGMVLTMPNA